jgi:predicted glycosyltransferase
MDAPHLLDVEWKRNDTMHKIGMLYDDIWVYGPPDFYDPLTGLDVPDSVREKMNFVGFLQRKSSVKRSSDAGEYLIVTTGGGGDGSDLVRDVIAAYKADATLTIKAMIVLGPYMPNEQRLQFMEHAADDPRIEIIEFDNRMEDRIAGARAVVAMGGYNTYCEILSFDKPALIVPRTQPRLEQLIRARRAAELGLVSMLPPQEAADSQRFANALKDLLKRDPPSASPAALHLEGLPTISKIVDQHLTDKKNLSLLSAQG